MPRDRRLWVVDTSVLVSYFRAGRHGEFLRGAIERGVVFLPGVVLCELQVGATTRDDRANLARLRQTLAEKIVETHVGDWLLAGRCLARYVERWGSVRPRDHLADVLVAVTAARLRATVAAEDIRGMNRWAWALGRFGAQIRVQSLAP